MRWLVILGIVLLPGCMNITARTQPEDTSIQEIREASDCVPIILGFAYGSATLEGALAEDVWTTAGRHDYNIPKQKIAKVRRVQLHDYQFLFFGARCVEVVGE